MAHPVEDANDRSPYGDLTAEAFYEKHGIEHSSAYITNSRGMKIFTQSWKPKGKELLGIVCVVHGFTGESGWLVALTSVGIAKQGFGVYALDHQGHGLSDGLRYHIPDIAPVVDDCIHVFDTAREENEGLPAFLYAESLGGAIALMVHLRQPTVWSGAVLNGAMCGISEKFKPPWPLEHLLGVVAWAVPTWPVVPTRGNIPGRSFKVEWKQRLATASPHRVLIRPRAATALELMRVCRDLQGRFGDVTVPLLIVHGEGDTVCDPASVQRLYEQAASEDKQICVYEGMWHQLVGESKENVERVFGDVFGWLVERAHRHAKSAVTERWAHTK